MGVSHQMAANEPGALDTNDPIIIVEKTRIEAPEKLEKRPFDGTIANTSEYTPKSLDIFPIGELCLRLPLFGIAVDRMKLSR